MLFIRIVEKQQCPQYRTFTDTLSPCETITETIFAWPGMGKLLIDAINKSDRPIIVAYLMAAACMFVVLNFIVDILYTLIDPRIELR